MRHLPNQTSPTSRRYAAAWSQVIKRILFTAAVYAGVAGFAEANQQPQQIDERTIPKKFHSEWNEKRNDCGTGNNDSSLTITATEMHFYESDGAVRGAFMNGPYEILVVADMSGEGSSWMSSFHYTLAGDGDYLSMRMEDGSLFVRYRCPAR